MDMRSPIPKTLVSAIARFADSPRPRNVQWFWDLGDLLFQEYRASYGRGLTEWIVAQFPGELSKSDLRRAVRLRKYYRPEKLHEALSQGLSQSLKKVRHPKPGYQIMNPVTFEVEWVYPALK